MGVTFAPPRLERLGPLVMAGRRERHPLGRDRLAVYADIAAQWRAFVVRAQHITALPPVRGYGVGFKAPAGEAVIDYFSGFVVAGPACIPAGFDRLDIPPVTVAVFDHPDHISHLFSTVKLITDTVLPMAAIEPSDDPGLPQFLQRYTEAFDPATGFGGIEVLVPVKVEGA